MTYYGVPILYALFLWWFGTGLILYLDGLPRRTFRWSMLGAAIVLAGALYGLAASSSELSVGAAYVAFTCSVLVWGFNEISFLMGYVTGPRADPCAPGCRGWRRFTHAVAVILYHELAILASAALVAALTWGAPNQIGLWTFVILWVMRLSAKFNVFLGVPNVTEEFLPDHLAYMKGFFRKRAMNGLFPVSVTAATIVAALLVKEAAVATEPFATVGYALLATLLALAIIEHWFFVLPIPAASLWRWSLQKRAGARSCACRPASAARKLIDLARSAFERDPPDSRTMFAASKPDAFLANVSTSAELGG